MPVVADQTREEIRGFIGDNLGAVWISTTTSAGSTTTVIDLALQGGTDDHNGKWVIITSGSRDGDISRVTAFDGSTGTLTVAPVLGGTPGSGETYELWDEAYDPRVIHRFINQAIMSVYGHAYNPVESVALHGDGVQRRFDIPSGFSMLNRIEVRDSVDGIVLVDCDTSWTSVDSDVTQANDSEVRKSGQSIKFTIAAGIGAGDELGHQDFSDVDMSRMTHLEFWAWSSLTAAAADFGIDLYDGVTQRENLDFPALVADTWTFIRIALTAMEVNTAIDEVRIIYATALGAMTLWLDDIKAVNEDSAEWVRLDPYYWRIDKDARDLILINGGRNVLGYHLMKLIGGDEPLLLTSDSNVNEVDDQYVTAKATELALLSTAGGSLVDPENRRAIIGFWAGMARNRRSSFPMLTDVKQVE